MGRQKSDGTYIKKGPWSAEEDETLMNYVKKHGSKGWSSIRSMGLLPRTGKSCRLRWVNKLRPNLKIGCKFSAEEERVVIELQEQFGNKWAKIATHLQGRTDNDVKNFWSARRKRLKRSSQTPAPKLLKNKGKDPVLHEMPMMEIPRSNCIPLEQGSTSLEVQYSHPSFSGNSGEAGMVPLSLPVETDILDIAQLHMKPPIDPFVNYIDPLRLQSQLDFPVLPEFQDLAAEANYINCMSMFKHQEASETNCEPKSLTAFQSTGEKGNAQNGNEVKINPETPDRFFDELPADLFDYLDTLPNSPKW